MWNSQIECLARPDLERMQLARLKQTLERVYANVPFYKALLDGAGYKPEQIKTLKDLPTLPFTKKIDLREHYPFGLFASPLNRVARLHASSGTKGKPTVVGYTKNDIDTWAEIVARSLAAAGTRTGDVLHNSYGYGLFTGGLGLHYGAELLGATVVPASGGRTQQQITLLKDFGARILCSTPSFALNISYAIEEMEIPRSSVKLEIGIFGAEPWTEQMRAQLQDRLHIQALDIYGLSEVMGPGVSMECIQARNGLHIWEDHFLPEIINPETGAPMPQGEEGELVFTFLTKEAVPLIRYRTGDLSSLMYERCKCGRTMARMARIKARLDDMLIIRGVNLFPSEVEKLLLEIEGLAPHYQIVVDRLKALDVLEVQVEVTDSAAAGAAIEGDRVVLNDLQCKVQYAIKDKLGLTAEVSLIKPKGMERSDGKAVRVIDKRKQEDAASSAAPAAEK